MAGLPRSPPEVEARLPDEAACGRRLLAKRGPDGFRCPARGRDEAREPGRERLALRCAARERQVSVTAGTVLHGSRLPSRARFLAARLVATHAGGLSARQLWRQLGPGGHKPARLLVRKPRRAMVDPERGPLAGLLEVDETGLPFRAEGEPARPGRSHEGEPLLAGAVEIEGEGPGRTRLAVIGDCSAESLGAFVAGDVADGGTVASDGRSGRGRLRDVEHDPRVVGDAPAHPVLPRAHRVSANAKRRALGVRHGPRPGHLQAHLDEFVSRSDRRRTPHAAFDRLLGPSLALQPATYRMPVGRS